MLPRVRSGAVVAEGSIGRKARTVVQPDRTRILSDEYAYSDAVRSGQLRPGEERTYLRVQRTCALMLGFDP